MGTVRQGLRVAVPLLLIAAALLGGTAIFAARVIGPSDATVVTLADRLPQPVLHLNTVLDESSGLHGGDVVVLMDGIPVDRAELLRGRTLAVGDVVTYTVQRGGEIAAGSSAA